MSVQTHRPDELGHDYLEIRGLTVDFDGFKAIDGVDLTLLQGRLHFLIGPNGAGKTTLVDAVTGLVQGTGRASYRNQDLLSMKSHRIVRAGVGRTFQTATVFEELSVLQNLDIAGGVHRSPWGMLRARRGVPAYVEEALATIGLSHLRDRPAGVLAHGQKQWLEIGMLLMQEPELLLMDEPVAGMTPLETERTGELLLSLAGKHSLIVVEHDMGFVRSIAKRVTVLHEGRVLAEGDMDSVQNDPQVVEVYLGA